MISYDIQADSVNPGEKPLPRIKLPDVPISSDEYFLRQIVGILTAPCHAEGEVEDHPLVGVDKSCECPALALENALNYLIFFGRGHGKLHACEWLQAFAQITPDSISSQSKKPGFCKYFYIAKQFKIVILAHMRNHGDLFSP